MSGDLVKRLRYGIVEHRKRWSGDTHADLGGSVDYDATTDMLHEAADRIEELEAKLAKAVGALDNLMNIVDGSDTWVANTISQHDAVITLAELKGETND